jgi:hypothetical protein
LPYRPAQQSRAGAREATGISSAQGKEFMKRIAWLRGTLALSVFSAASWAMAADHRDAPGVTADPAADITDLYTWTDQGNAIFVLNVTPLAMASTKFSNKVQYVIHTESSMSYGQAGQKTDIIVTFDANQKASVWVGDKDYVTGDASVMTGLASADGKFKVFAGLRDDPFFFNLEGFKETVNIINGALPSLVFDAAGCPKLDAASSTVLVMKLNTGVNGTAPVDFFGGTNVLSIVLSIDKSLLNTGGPILRSWASTNVGG